MQAIKSTVAVIIGAIILAGAFILFFNSPIVTDASVEVGGEYFATTTQPSLTAATSIADFRGTTAFVSRKPGALGSIIVASTTVGSIAFYDATTTNITLRGNAPTTTLAVLPSAIAAGVYQFDVAFGRGLIVETSSNFNGNYVITYR